MAASRRRPSRQPTFKPSPGPTLKPTSRPTRKPTPKPSPGPTPKPSPLPTQAPTFQRTFPVAVLEGVSAAEFNDDSLAKPTFERAVANTVPGSTVKAATAAPLATPLAPDAAGGLRRRFQTSDACKVDFTVMLPGGTGQQAFVRALRDGTFARNFNAVRGRSPALRGARVAEDRSREENGDDPAATTKKSGGGGGSAPLLLIILAVVGACILCAAAGACVYARRGSKDKARATAAYSAQRQRSSEEGGAFGIGISRSFSRDEERAKEEDLRGSMVLSNNVDPRILGLISSRSSNAIMESDEPLAASLLGAGSRRTTAGASRGTRSGGPRARRTRATAGRRGPRRTRDATCAACARTAGWSWPTRGTALKSGASTRTCGAASGGRRAGRRGGASGNSEGG